MYECAACCRPRRHTNTRMRGYVRGASSTMRPPWRQRALANTNKASSFMHRGAIPQNGRRGPIKPSSSLLLYMLRHNSGGRVRQNRGLCLRCRLQDGVKKIPIVQTLIEGLQDNRDAIQMPPTSTPFKHDGLPTKVPNHHSGCLVATLARCKLNRFRGCAEGSSMGAVYSSSPA